MATDRGLTVTADQARWDRFVWETVDQIEDTALVLKGGVALVRACRLNRRSTDLEFGPVRQQALVGMSEERRKRPESQSQAIGTLPQLRSQLTYVASCWQRRYAHHPLQHQRSFLDNEFRPLRFSFKPHSAKVSRPISSFGAITAAGRLGRSKADVLRAETALLANAGFSCPR